jgi:hypothetical protein
MQVGEAVTIDVVVFTLPGGLELPGTRSLEGLNPRFDALAEKLVAGGPIPAASPTLWRRFKKHESLKSEN